MTGLIWHTRLRERGRVDLLKAEEGLEVLQTPFLGFRPFHIYLAMMCARGERHVDGKVSQKVEGWMHSRRAACAHDRKISLGRVL